MKTANENEMAKTQNREIFKSLTILKVPRRIADGKCQHGHIFGANASTFTLGELQKNKHFKMSIRALLKCVREHSSMDQMNFAST